MSVERETFSRAEAAVVDYSAYAFALRAKPVKTE
jgi:hypothetical protein